LASMKRPFLVGEGCRLADGVKLVDTVLGDNVTIAKPMRLKRCVVLSDVDLREGEDYSESVITREGVLRPYLEA